MSEPTLFITGVTGFIGFAILLDALKAGYRVRVAVRNEYKGKRLLGNKHLQKQLAASGRNALEIVHVADILAPGAYDDVLTGGSITHIIHSATPLAHATDNARRDIIEPALQGTLNLLRAAARTPSVRRVVLTASPVANMAFPPDPTLRVVPSSRLPDPTEEQMDNPNMQLLEAYCYSKIAAINAADRFARGAARDKVAFDIVNVFPGVVLGQNLFAGNVEELSTGSNRFLHCMITGDMGSDPAPGVAAHIEDVAAVHITALDEKIVPFRSDVDLGAMCSFEINKAWKIAEEHFPQAVKDGLLKQGDVATVPLIWDASETEKLLGRKFLPLEDMVTSYIKQYLQLSKA